MHTVSIAGSRGRVSLTALETFIRYGEKHDLFIVRESVSIPSDTSTERQYSTVRALIEFVKQENHGTEPRLIVQYGSGAGTAIFLALREEHAQGKLRERPMAYSTSVATADRIAIPVTADLFAGNLWRIWHNDWLSIASGLEGLREQLRAFDPARTKAGALVLGDEMAAWDDAVVSVMFAFAMPGRGVQRFEDRFGKVWPSQLLAEHRQGQGARS